MMTIERKPHPRGNPGAKVSIDEVAKRASEGRSDPRVRAWAIEQWINGGAPNGTKDKAEILLRALRKQRAYVPDPVDVEFIPSAACTLAGCDGLTFFGEDCDGLVVAYLAACGSIGIDGAVVAHAYPGDGQLSHVLAAIWDGARWHMADPSTSQPFGVASPASTEKWVAVPGGQVLCDGDCKRVGRPEMSYDRAGEFVGVGQGASIEPYVTPALEAALRMVIREKHQQLQSAFAEYVREAAIINSLERQTGEPFFDNPQLGSEINSTRPTIETAARYASEGESGVRQVGKDGVGDAVVLGRPDEDRVLIGTNGELILAPGSQIQPIGWHTVALVAVISAAAITGVVTVVDYLKEKLQAERTEQGRLFIEKQVAKGESYKSAVDNYQRVLAAAEREAKGVADSSTGAELGSTIRTVAYSIVAIGGLVAGAYVFNALMAGKKRVAQ